MTTTCPTKCIISTGSNRESARSLDLFLCTSVYVLFPGTQKCVPARTFLLSSANEFLRSLSYKNEPDMHVLCASSDTQARTHVREVSNPPSHSTQPSTHHMDEYHDDIRWAGAPRVAYPDVMLGEKNEARDVLFFFFVAVLTNAFLFVAAPPSSTSGAAVGHADNAMTNDDNLRRRTKSNGVR